MDAAEDRERVYFIAGAKFAAPALAPGLHVVATPIGNLKDITLRALETLAGADVVLCEDTRHSAHLLSHYGISSERRALHEHNERAAIAPILAAIAAGRAYALISDAGTPLLSDPGFPLVRAVREAGLALFSVPGPSALLAGLAIAGLPTDSFAFFGFLPPKAGARANAIAALKLREETLVFYESPRRLGETLGALAGGLSPDRPAAVALELTKRFERVETGPLGALAERFSSGDTRGEAVVLVGGALQEELQADGTWDEALVQALAAAPLRDAVDSVARQFGVRRREVYARALAIRGEER